MRQTTYDKVLRSNWFLCALLASGIGLILTQAYFATEGDIALMAMLLLAITIAFVLLVAFLQGMFYLLRRFIEWRTKGTP